MSGRSSNTRYWKTSQRHSRRSSTCWFCRLDVCRSLLYRISICSESCCRPIPGANHTEQDARSLHPHYDGGYHVDRHNLLFRMWSYISSPMGDMLTLTGCSLPMYTNLVLLGLLTKCKRTLHQPYGASCHLICRICSQRRRRFLLRHLAHLHCQGLEHEEKHQNRGSCYSWIRCYWISFYPGSPSLC